MATLAAAGFAFAIAGKIVNEFFPSEQSQAMTIETRRHNLALEKFTADRNRWEKEVRNRMDLEHYYDRENKSVEIRKSKSLDYIIEYAKEKRMRKPPVFEDYLKAEIAKPKPSSGYVNLMRSAGVASLGGIATYVVIKYI